MRYGSVCSGIEAATVAWDSLGWTPQWFSEIEPFPSAVLAHHYPNVPNFGDMTKFKEWKLDDSTAIDVLVGGTPCQSFSVAGLRKGLEDPRGNLMLTYLAIANKYRPKWLVWENVPGVLSSNGGQDFASFLRGLGELGYGFAYRVLDAQYFGVAQRRRRVFVVGCLGDWRSAAAVLFERHSLSGHPAPSREKRQEVAKCITRGIAQRFDSETETMIPVYGGSDPECADTVTSKWAKGSGGPSGSECGLFVAQPIPIHDQATRHLGKHGNKQDGKGNGLGIGQPGDPMNTLTKGDRHAVAQPIPLDLRNAGRDPEKHDEINRQGVGVGEPGDPAHTLTTACVHGVAQPIPYGIGELPDTAHCLRSGASKADKHESTTYVAQPIACEVADTLSVGANQTTGFIGDVVAQPIGFEANMSQHQPSTGGVYQTLTRRTHASVLIPPSMAVRRLTPVECERLQGFPDGYTNIPWRKKEESPDGPRYKALGNSMAVPVMHWIGKRIADAP